MTPPKRPVALRTEVECFAATHKHENTKKKRKREKKKGECVRRRRLCAQKFFFCLYMCIWVLLSVLPFFLFLVRCSNSFFCIVFFFFLVHTCLASFCWSTAARRVARLFSRKPMAPAPQLCGRCFIVCSGFHFSPSACFVTNHALTTTTEHSSALSFYFSCCWL